MPIYPLRVKYNQGVEVERQEADTDTDEIVTKDGAGAVVSTVPLPAEEKERLTAAEREENQLARLDGKFGELKSNTSLQDASRLTVSDYGPVSQDDMRDVARLVNDLRAIVIDQRSMILDLTRLVRNMAAED